jgi:hypothetical protein
MYTNEDMEIAYSAHFSRFFGKKKMERQVLSSAWRSSNAEKSYAVMRPVRRGDGGARIKA